MSFIRKWILANTTAMFVSYLFYTPIAHGMPSRHKHYLTPYQLIAHIIDLIVVALILFLSQKYELKKYINISWLSINEVNLPITATAITTGIRKIKPVITWLRMILKVIFKDPHFIFC